MIDAVAEPDVLDELARPLGGVGRRRRATSVGIRTFSSTVHCGSRQ